MSLYTFYFSRSGESASSFEAHELLSHTDLEVQALHLLSQHTTCALVEVWRDDKRVLTHARVDPGPGALLSRSAA